jgi:hypothetical protein
MNPHSYTHLIVDKGTKNIQCSEKRQLLQQMLLGTLDTSLQKRKLDPCLSPFRSTNSKWIKYLNIRPETLKLVQERAGNTLEAIGVGNDFLSRTHLAQQLREKIGKWDSVKLKSFCMAKEMATHIEGENLCQLHIR